MRIHFQASKILQFHGENVRQLITFWNDTFQSGSFANVNQYWVGAFRGCDAWPEAGLDLGNLEAEQTI